MQRIAWGCVFAALLVAGCQAPQKPTQSRLPEPLLHTRQPKRHLPPPVKSPPPPPVAQAPAPTPALPPSSTYFNPSELTPSRAIQRGRWQVIVVHHSASPNDTPSGMDNFHRNVRGWSGGLGYHFVIGNGVGYPDGKVYPGPRWKLQETGAHCKAAAGRYFGSWRPNNYFNSNGIGICLIGNFDSSQPTPHQLEALRRLIQHLCENNGINPAYVYGHGEITNKTACPGRGLKSQLANVKRSVASALALELDLAGAATLASGLHGDLSPCAECDLHHAFSRARALPEVAYTSDALVADGFDDVADAYASAVAGTVLENIDHNYAPPLFDAGSLVGFWRDVGQP